MPGLSQRSFGMILECVQENEWTFYCCIPNTQGTQLIVARLFNGDGFAQNAPLSTYNLWESFSEQKPG